MLDAGILKNPSADIGMALHVSSGVPSGKVLCCTGTAMAGCTFFRIKVKGTGCHGAMPNKGIDPINIAAHIYLSLQEIIAREISPLASAVVTIGHFSAGEVANVIPDEAVMEGSVRVMDGKIDRYIFKRIEEISTQTAALFRGEAEVEQICAVPPMTNSGTLVREMASYIEEICHGEQIELYEKGGMGSEDFAIYTKEIPCCYLILGAGTKGENEAYGAPMHNKNVVFNEDILPLGAAIFAHCAVRCLGEQR